jgi:hypothetical protein
MILQLLILMVNYVDVHSRSSASNFVTYPFVVLLPQLALVVLFEELVVLVVEYSPFDLIFLVENSVNLFVMILQLLILMVKYVDVHSR